MACYCEAWIQIYVDGLDKKGEVVLAKCPWYTYHVMQCSNCVWEDQYLGCDSAEARSFQGTPRSGICSFNLLKLRGSLHSTVLT